MYPLGKHNKVRVRVQRYTVPTSGVKWGPVYAEKHRVLTRPIFLGRSSVGRGICVVCSAQRNMPEPKHSCRRRRGSLRLLRACVIAQCVVHCTGVWRECGSDVVSNLIAMSMWVPEPRAARLLRGQLQGDVAACSRSECHVL